MSEARSAEEQFETVKEAVVGKERELQVELDQQKTRASKLEKERLQQESALNKTEVQLEQSFVERDRLSGQLAAEQERQQRELAHLKEGLIKQDSVIERLKESLDNSEANARSVREYEGFVRQWVLVPIPILLSLAVLVVWAVRQLGIESVYMTSGGLMALVSAAWMGLAYRRGESLDSVRRTSKFMMFKRITKGLGALLIVLVVGIVGNGIWDWVDFL